MLGPFVMDTHRSRRGDEAFTLMEVLMSILIVALVISGIVAGFMQTEKQAEWSAYNLAAQSLAMQPIEQARGAKWDPYAVPPSNELTNLPVRTTNVLDIPISGQNIVYATNVTTVRQVPGFGPKLMEISVVTTWPFFNRGTFTNTVVTYRAPDQ